MLQKTQILCGIAVSLVLAGAAHADKKLTWFGETVFTGAYPTDASDNGSGVPQALRDDPYKLLNDRSPSLIENQVAVDRVFRDDTSDLQQSANTLRSEVGFALGEETFSIPILHRNSLFHDGRSDELNALGLKWRHQFEGLGSLTLATHYGKGASTSNTASLRADTANTLTSVSWTSDIGNTGSAVTGSLFYGNEQQENSAAQDPTRRVYGLAVGGQWAVSQRHLPYVALRYQAGDPANGLTPTDLEDYTRISAGWNWRVNPNWNVRAEANFTYNQPTWDLFNVSQTRILFSTRFDMR